MKSNLMMLLASASVLAVGSTAAAQTAPAPTAAAPAEDVSLGEIVVTARRKSESLQEVPQTVNAITADALNKLNITQFSDIQNVTPGLSLNAAPTGYQYSASLRGISFEVVTAAQPTVALYMNDAPVQPGQMFQSLFDVGQIEILKGPQGTTRGISAPSGAITLTTHKPDLSAFGGYINFTATDLQGRNLMAAVNVPLIKDVLAVRVAGLFDQNDFNGVRSIHSSVRPRSVTTAERISVSFEPNDRFNANVMWQHLDKVLTSFQQVSGPGQPAFTIGGVSYPASYNPALTPEMRVSVNDLPTRSQTQSDVVVAQFDSRLFGQHLSYVGSYQRSYVDLDDTGSSASGGDNGDLLPHVDLFQTTLDTTIQTTHEFRISSDPAPGRFFDYTAGVFYNWNSLDGGVYQPGILLPGAFGVTPGVDLSAFNPNYQIPLFINLEQRIQETSIFGNVTFHLGANTELSGGIRHMWSIAQYNNVISTRNGLLNLGALGLNGLGAFCPQIVSAFGFPGVSGPGANECTVLSASAPSRAPTRFSETPNIYNVSLSHHFTRDFLGYVNTGTAFRPGVSTAGLQGDLATSTIPALEALNIHPSERSRTYEVGFKSTFLDGRARFNAAIYQQRFHNMPILTGPVAYLSEAGNPASANNFKFTASVDAVVKGFDLDGAYQITPEWNVSAQLAYADAKVDQGSSSPCNLTDASGKPVYNTGGIISLCPGGTASRLPLWNATFQSEYFRPVADNVDGFIRGLATYYPENKNRVEPNFTIPPYSLINLYAGVRSHDGAWEVSLFARNAFNAQRTLDVATVQENLNTSLLIAGALNPELVRASGYYETNVTPRREVGINVRYAFGSR
jgi:iron complex outermembrane receptor protein